MNGRFGFVALVFVGLLCGSATLASACDRLSSAAVFAVPQQAAVFSAVPVFGQAVVVQSGNCFVPRSVVSVQSFGGGVSVATNFRGFSVQAIGGRRTVVRQGGLRGLLFGNVVRSR